MMVDLVINDISYVSFYLAISYKKKQVRPMSSNYWNSMSRI